jgi:hypothetical protein
MFSIRSKGVLDPNSKGVRFWHFLYRRIRRARERPLPSLFWLCLYMKARILGRLVQKLPGSALPPSPTSSNEYLHNNHNQAFNLLHLSSHDPCATTRPRR